MAAKVATVTSGMEAAPIPFLRPGVVGSMNRGPTPLRVLADGVVRADLVASTGTPGRQLRDPPNVSSILCWGTVQCPCFPEKVNESSRGERAPLVRYGDELAA